MCAGCLLNIHTRYRSVFIEDPVCKQGLVVFIDFGSAVLAAGDGVPAVSVVVGEVLTDAVFKFLSDDPAPAVVCILQIADAVLISILQIIKWTIQKKT